MRKEYEEIMKKIREDISIKMQKLHITQQELLQTINNKYYDIEISQNKISRLMNTEKGSTDLDMELLYYVFTELDLRFDPFFFHEEEIMNFDFNKLSSKLNTKYELQKKICFNNLAKVINKNKVDSENLIPIWKEINNKTYLSCLRPRVTILGNFASGTSTLINFLLERSLNVIQNNVPSSDLNYYIHSDYKPFFLSESAMQLKYKEEGFSLEHLNDSEKLAKQNEKYVSVYFSNNEILKYITLVECKTRYENVVDILSDSTNTIYLTSLENRTLKTDIEKVIDKTKKLDLIINRINENITGEDYYKSQLLNIFTNTSANNDFIKKLIEDSIAYDAYDRNSYSNVITLFTSIIEKNQDALYVKGNEPLEFMVDFPKEYELLKELKNPTDFFSKLPDYWESFSDTLKSVLTNNQNINLKISNYFDKYLNEEYLKTLYEIKGLNKIITKDEKTDILQITKDNIKIFADTIDEDINKYCINRIFDINLSSYVNEVIFSKLWKGDTDVYNYFCSIYKEIVDPLCNERKSFSYEYIKDINSSCRPKIKTISKHIYYKDNDFIKNNTIILANTISETIINRIEARKKESLDILKIFSKEESEFSNVNKLINILTELKTERNTMSTNTIFAILEE